MIYYDDYFGDFTEEEYIKQTEEHFKFLKEMSKCGNAHYCRYSEEDLYCVADDEIVEKCPYLKAIQQITLLSMELTESYELGGDNMYNKKYRLEKIEEFNKPNFIYEGVEGSICYPAYFNVGERGWFLYIEDGGWYEYAHRIHTSVIKNVEYLDDKIIVETQNTRFTFVLISN